MTLFFQAFLLTVEWVRSALFRIVLISYNYQNISLLFCCIMLPCLLVVGYFMIVILAKEKLKFLVNSR